MLFEHFFDMAVKALLYVTAWLKFQVRLSVIEFKSEELHPARGTVLCHEGEKQQTLLLVGVDGMR